MTAWGQQGHLLPGPPTSARTGAILQMTGTGKHAVLEAVAMRGVTPLGQQVVGGAGVLARPLPTLSCGLCPEY